MKEKIKILGEYFEWYYDNEYEMFFITHPIWSLAGMGETLQEAHRDLLLEIEEVKEYYCKCPDERLSSDAINFKRWLTPIVFYDYSYEA